MDGQTLLARWIDDIPPSCSITQASCTSGSLTLTLTGSENITAPE